MKLLLTSAGITNKKIESALLELLDKPFGESNLLFIPTAANVEDDKSYVEKDFAALQKLKFKSVEILDIASENNNIIEKAIKSADLVWFSGGNTFYLLDQLNKTGLTRKLPSLLNNKIYGGISAGSIVATPTISIANVEPADTNDVGIVELSALGLTDFEISPHTFGIVSIDNVSKYAESTSNTIYAIDDNGAIKMDGDKIEVISDGEYKIFN